MGGFLRFALPLIAFLSLFPLYTRYKAATAPVPPAVEAYLAGLRRTKASDGAEGRCETQGLIRYPFPVYGALRASCEEKSVLIG